MQRVVTSVVIGILAALAAWALVGAWASAAQVMSWQVVFLMACLFSGLLFFYDLLSE